LLARRQTQAARHLASGAAAVDGISGSSFDLNKENSGRVEGWSNAH